MACKQKGFIFVGCELDKGYVDIANKRLEQYNLLDILSENNQSKLLG